MSRWFVFAFLGVSQGSGLLVLLPILSIVLLFVKTSVLVTLSLRYYRSRAWITEGGPLPKSVTVIVPAYNEELGIGNTLHSLEQQTFPDLEVLVVNDGSTDNTEAVASQIAKTMTVRTRVLSKPNGGKADALNFGLAFVLTDVVLCVDADSALARDAVERIVETFADPSVGGVGGLVRLANRKSLLGRLQAMEYISGLMLLRAAFAQLHAMQIMSGPISAFRTADLKLIGGYSEDTVVEDFDVTVAMHKAGHKVLFHPEAISYTEGPLSLKDLMKQRRRWTYGCFQVLKKHRRQLFTGRIGWLSRVGLPYILVFPWIDVITQILFWATVVYCIVAQKPVTFGLFIAVLAGMTFALSMYAVQMAHENRWLAVWGILIPLSYQHLIAFVTLTTGIKFLLRREASWGTLERHGENALPVGIYDFVGGVPDKPVSLDE